MAVDADICLTQNHCQQIPYESMTLEWINISSVAWDTSVAFEQIILSDGHRSWNQVPNLSENLAQNK